MPTGFGDMGARQIEYAGNVLDVHVYKDECVYLTPQTQGRAMTVVISDFVSGNGDYYADVDGKEYKLTERADGSYAISLAAGFARVKIIKK